MDAKELQEWAGIPAALAEVAACLGDVPPDANAASVKAWLFTRQNNVAVRMARLLENADARAILTETAGRTWKQATPAKGAPEQLWQRLNRELTPLAQGASDALERKADFAPKGLLASMFSPKHTCREVALMAWNFTRHALTCKADLIFPYHGAYKLLPADEAVWRWVKLPHASKEAVDIPPVGDFAAALIVNRLAMVKELLCFLANLANGGRIDSQSANWNHELAEQVQNVRNLLWDSTDAEERSGAMALLQVYLAGAEHRRGFEADWSVIPWPAEPENMSLFIIDRSEQKQSFDDDFASLWVWRNHALAYTFDTALEKHSEDTLRIVRAGLEKLKQRLNEQVQFRARAANLAKQARAGMANLTDWQDGLAAGYDRVAENVERIGQEIQTPDFIDAEPVKSLPEPSRRKPGRKKLPPKEERRRLAILERWERASGECSRKDFCADEGIMVKQLENFQRWKQQRENRGE